MKVRLLLDRVISSYLVLHYAGSFKLVVYFVYNIIVTITPLCKKMKSTEIFIPFNLQEDKTLKFARTKLRKGYTKDNLSQGPVVVSVNEIISQQIRSGDTRNYYIISMLSLNTQVRNWKKRKTYTHTHARPPWEKDQSMRAV